MTSQTQQKPVAVKALIGFELFWAFISFASSIPLLVDPSGGIMGLPLETLENTPISDFTLVGVWFVTGFGLFPLVSAWGLWTKKRLTWTDSISRWTHQHWSWSASLLFVVICEIWIIVEMVLIGYHWLQGLFMIIPLIPLVLVFLPSVRTHFKEHNQTH